MAGTKFESTINENSIKRFNERWDSSRVVLTGYAAIAGVFLIVTFFGGAAITGFLVFPPVGVLMLILGVIALIAYKKFYFGKRDQKQEANDYFIEVFHDHLILNGVKKGPATIKFSQIRKIEPFQFELTKFKDNDIDADLEQSRNPYIHIATDNKNLYKLTYLDDGKEKEQIIDVGDAERFSSLVPKFKPRPKEEPTTDETKEKVPSKEETSKKNLDTVKDDAPLEEGSIVEKPSGKMVTIVCPGCETEFDIKDDADLIRCPNCGIEGQL